MKLNDKDNEIEDLEYETDKEDSEYESDNYDKYLKEFLKLRTKCNLDKIIKYEKDIQTREINEKQIFTRISKNRKFNYCFLVNIII